MSINVNDKNLGHATAYAYYKAGGGTMTEAEFTEFMADFGTASQTAVEAAQAALASETAAQTAATTATNKASEATTAATTATNKAAEAQADADAAALDASQAMSAASTATTKATEATTAAATATSAKTDAVAANTAAQSAKTAAQTAQTGAETAAASVSASAAQIATNAEDISQLKSELTDLQSDLGYAQPILTTSDFSYGAYLSAVGRRTDGAYGMLKSSDIMLPVEDLVITLDANDVDSTNYIYTIALYDDGTYRTNYNTNTSFVNGVARISASDIQTRFPGANGMRINVGIFESGSFVLFPSTTDISVADSTSVTIVDRVTAIESQLSNKKYYVVDANGNGDYTSLYVAVNALPEKSLIFVRPGEYLIPNSRYLGLRDKEMYIIGQDRDSCIITSYDGRYEYPAVWANSGLLENLTIRSIYLSGESNEIDANTNGAYAVHYDQESSIGKTLTIRNCKMVSEFNAAIGIGMRKDATLNVEDCFIKSDMVSGRGKYNYGAMLVHDSIGVQGVQYFNMKNCLLMSNLGTTMTINNVRGGDNVVHCQIVGNVLKDAQNGYANNVVLGSTPFTSVFVKDICYGNSNDNLNEN